MQEWEKSPPPSPPEHGCVKIRLRYANGDKRTPWKWHAVCICGLNILSWDWGRTIAHVSHHLAESMASVANTEEKQT